MEELIEEAKRGNSNAFTELIVCIKNDLYKIARMRLTCEDDINEAVQETIIIAFKSVKKVRESKFFKTWIIKILINECNKIYKINQKNNFVQYENVNYESNSYEIENKINDLDFDLLINLLNYDERIAITLYYLEDFTTQKISKILKEQENKIKSRISRAKNKIKNICKGDIYNG